VGRLVPIPFGDELWPSKSRSLAEKNYASLVGKNVKQARAQIVELLASERSSVCETKPALVKEPQKIMHSVKFFEKGDRPLEFITTRQWYVSLLKHKDRMLKLADSIQWHPEYMKARYLSWTQNLNLDWCISRQRYFGVAIPVRYRTDEKGEILYDQVLLPEISRLPIDPMSDCPSGFEESQRNQPNGFVGEMDVFDTWFTSSMSPQIGSHWKLATSRHEKIFPMDLRPQGHEIIRTWAFYTMAKSLLHEGKEPWKHIALSGWIVDPNRKKMSKSKGNTVTPENLLDEYGADPIRFWAASARLGADTAYDEQTFKVGRRLVTKLYNASKFVLAQEAPPGKIEHPLDLAFLTKLQKLVQRVTDHFDQFNYAPALQEIDKFFWTHFTDSYIELVKNRAKDNSSAASSAVASLQLGLHHLLRLFAPFMPYLTEEIWSWKFSDGKSIHEAKWPQPEELATYRSENGSELFDAVSSAYSLINKWKTEMAVSLMSEVPHLSILGPKKVLDCLKIVQEDLQKTCRIEKLDLLPLEDESAELKIQAS
jgi:valyl-tRNA synthetase